MKGKIKVSVKNIPGLLKNQTAWEFLREWESIASDLLRHLPKQRGSRVAFNSLVIRPLYTRGGLKSPAGTCWQCGRGINGRGQFIGYYVIGIDVVQAIKDGDRGLDTLIHELAHLFVHWETRRGGHGDDWQRWYVELKAMCNEELFAA